MAEHPPDTTFDLKFRIISCRKLLKGDRNSSDPYVKIMLGKKELHRTKHVLKTLNPIFAEKDEHTFSAKINYGELTKAGGVSIEVKDWDRIGTNDLIGLGNIDPARLLSLAKIGKPTSIKLEVPKGRKETDAGFVTLCIQDPTGAVDPDSDDDSFNAASVSFSSDSEEAPYPVGAPMPNTASVSFSSDSEEAPYPVGAPMPNMVVSEEPKNQDITKPEPPADATFDLKFRIISCRKLLKGDRNSSDPYVKIMLGKKELHRTKHLVKSLNPVFSTTHDNTFSAQVNYGELTKAGGLGIEVKDWDRIGNNDLIGFSKIEPARLVELAKIGKPTTMGLDVPKGRKETEAGFVTLCVQDTGDGESSDDDWSGSGDDFEAPMPNLDFSTPAADGTGPPTYDKELLIEIMSCRNLIAVDRDGKSDPYVEIVMADKVLHKTQYVNNTLNPAFSVDHKNKYILKCSAKDLWANGGIELNVKDHDWDAAIGMKDAELGYVKIPPEKLYEFTGEYTDLNLRPPRRSNRGVAITDAGSIAIRVRETKLEDKDKKAAADLQAVSGRNSPMRDDRAGWDADVGYSIIQPRREKVYTDSDDSSADSSDMYVDDSDDEKPPTKPPKPKLGATTTPTDENGDQVMPLPTPLAEQVTSKWGNQKLTGGGRGAGRGGGGGRGGDLRVSRGGRGALYVPSIHPGDMFDREIEALEEKQSTDDDGDSLEKEQDENDPWEQLIEKDAKINELQHEVETLKEQNSELRSELNKMRYRLKANKPKKTSSKKIPLAKKHSSNSEEEEDVAEEETKPKAEETPKLKSSLKKGKFNTLDFDGPSDDDDTVEESKEEETPKLASALKKGKFALDFYGPSEDDDTAEGSKEEEQKEVAPKPNVRSLDFGLDAPTFSSDEDDDSVGNEDKAPSRGVVAIDSVLSDVSALASPVPISNLLPPTRGIPGVRLSEVEEPSGMVLSPTRGIPGVDLSEIDHSARTEVTANASAGMVVPPTHGIPGVRMSEMDDTTRTEKSVKWRSAKSLNDTAHTYSSADESVYDSDEERKPARGLLERMGMTSSIIERASMYSFVEERSEDDDSLVKDENGLPDFDRKHKDKEFAALDFVGVANKKDKEKKQGKISTMPSLFLNVNASTVLSADADSDEERMESMKGVSVDKDYDKSSSRPVDENLEETTTTFVSQTAIQQTTISGRRVVELEQLVEELKEELALAKANPGGYEKASLEVQLKVAQDHSKKLEAQNARLQKMNKIQKEAMFEMNKKHKGKFW